MVLLVFFMPLLPIALPSIIVLLLFSFLTGVIMNTSGFRNISLRKTWPLLLYFILLASSLLYTQNTPQGLRATEVKLGFILFPFVLLPYSYKPILNKLFKVFIFACMLSFGIGLIVASARFLSEIYTDYRYLGTEKAGIQLYLSSFLSVFLHPSYLSMYCNFALFLLIYYSHRNNNSIFKQKTTGIFIVLLCLHSLMLMSKAGWLITGGLLIYYTIIKLQSTQYKWVLISWSVGLVLFGSVFYLVPGMKERAQSAVLVVRSGAQSETDSNAIRVLIWQQCVELIKEHPYTGVGIGDVNAALKEKYIERGLWTAIERNYNAHSQFLQNQLSGGIVASVSLLLIFVISIIKSEKKAIMIFLCILLFSNLLVESMFETQAGTVFASFFLSLLLIISTPKPIIDERKP
jgi:O-antigen ligase